MSENRTHKRGRRPIRTALITVAATTFLAAPAAAATQGATNTYDSGSTYGSGSASTYGSTSRSSSKPREAYAAPGGQYSDLQCSQILALHNRAVDNFLDADRRGDQAGKDYWLNKVAEYGNMLSDNCVLIYD